MWWCSKGFPGVQKGIKKEEDMGKDKRRQYPAKKEIEVNTDSFQIGSVYCDCIIYFLQICHLHINVFYWIQIW